MALDRETLRSLLDRTYSNYKSLLKSLDKTFHHNLMKVNFLSWQIFPDTASGEFLSMPYSDRVRSYMQAQWLEKPFRQAFPLNSSERLHLYFFGGKMILHLQIKHIGKRDSVEVWVRAKESAKDSNLAKDGELTVAIDLDFAP
jgi:hypothetical protein